MCFYKMYVYLYAALDRKLLNQYPPNLQQTYQLAIIDVLTTDTAMQWLGWFVRTQTKH